MIQREVYIAGIQKIRWVGCGNFKRKDNRINYSCHKNEHLYGRGFIITERIREIIIDFRPVRIEYEREDS
jgi:hypothetical protein